MRGVGVTKETRPSASSAGFVISGFAMRFPDVLESADYGNPEDVLERKQAREARESERQRKAGTLHAKPGWSDARKAAEALFDFPAPESVQTSYPGTSRNAGHAGNRKDSA